MAAPTYATDLTDINLVETAGGTTNWSALGGGSAGLSSETDYFIQGDGSLSKAGFTATTKGMIYDATTTTITSGDAIFIWMKQNNRNLMDTQAAGGQQVVVGDSTSVYDHFYIDGSDSSGSDLAGWRTFAVDPTQTPSTSTGSPTTTNFIGGLWKILGSGSLKGNPNAIDAFRHGRELTIVDGDAGNGYATFLGAGAFDAATTRRWGILTPVQGGYIFHGAFVMGTTGTSTDFRDSNRTIAVLEDEFVPSTFNEFEIRHASSNVEWNNITISALGSTAPFILTLDVGTFTGDGCIFTGAGTTALVASSAMTNSQWISCDTVTAPASDLRGSKIITSVVGTDAGALVYNSATDTDGNLDNMTFSKGSNQHHAITFGTSVSSEITLRGIEFTDFVATQDDNGAALQFLNTTGGFNVNLVGCTVGGSPATSSNLERDDAACATDVNLVFDPVTVTVNVKDHLGVNLQNARVYFEASDGTGDLPYNASVTSITRSGTTATVTFGASHNLNTGEYINLSGITNTLNQKDNYGAKQVTYSSSTVVTYQTLNEGDTTYTGTITATGALLYGLTDASGNISKSKTLTNDQPLTGYVRKSSASPRYKTFQIAGTLPNDENLSISVRLVLDE